MVEIVALTVAAVFFGAAIYITIAEHPARLALDDTAAWRQWGPAYARGYAMQASLAIVGGIAGTWAWWQGGDPWWLIGAILLVANWAWTLLAIMPVNRRLQAMEPPVPQEARDLLMRWGRLHTVRSGLGGLATLAYIVAAA